MMYLPSRWPCAVVLTKMVLGVAWAHGTCWTLRVRTRAFGLPFQFKTVLMRGGRVCRGRHMTHTHHTGTQTWRTVVGGVEWRGARRSGLQYPRVASASSTVGCARVTGLGCGWGHMAWHYGSQQLLLLTAGMREASCCLSVSGCSPQSRTEHTNSTFNQNECVDCRPFALPPCPRTLSTPKVRCQRLLRMAAAGL